VNQPDYYFHVADPEVLGQPGSPNMVLRFQTVERQPEGSRRDGKYIHLELTTGFAMHLLAALKAAQQHLKLVEAPPPTTIAVPPAKDRN